MHFKAGGREVETIATDTVTQCSKNGKISVIFKKVELYPKNYTNFSNFFTALWGTPIVLGFLSDISYYVFTLVLSQIA